MNLGRGRRRPTLRGAGPVRGGGSPKAPRPAALRPGTRLGGPGRRTPRIRRASAGLTPVRAAALLVMVASAAAIYGAGASGAFTARRITVDGAIWTGEAAVREALALTGGENLFGLRTDLLEQRIVTLPAVAAADVAVALPDALRVTVVEREALLVWAVGREGWLVDREGVVFARLGDDPPAQAGDLATIEDRRQLAFGLHIGERVPPVDLDAALRLGSLKPSDVGSAAGRLRIRIDDTNGFVLHTQPDGWSAVFGFYTPTLRTPELIAGQVRLLRSFLLGREATVARIILADDRNGTYIPRVTPSPSPSPSASGTP
jgi:hypothetical protein